MKIDPFKFKITYTSLISSIKDWPYILLDHKYFVLFYYLSFRLPSEIIWHLSRKIKFQELKCAATNWTC